MWYIKGSLLDSEDQPVGLFDLDESEEDEDDLLQRTGNFLSTSVSLPRGILKVRLVQLGSVQLLLKSSLLHSTMYRCLMCVGLNMFAIISPYISLSFWKNKKYVPY